MISQLQKSSVLCFHAVLAMSISHLAVWTDCTAQYSQKVMCDFNQGIHVEPCKQMMFQTQLQSKLRWL